MSARGESVIHANGREIYLLFTTRACMSAEKQLGKSMPSIMRDFSLNNLSYTELAALLRAGMEAARMDAHTSGRPVSNNDAIDLIDEMGYTTVSAPIMEAVAAVMIYKPSDEGEVVEDGTDPN